MEMMCGSLFKFRALAELVLAKLHPSKATNILPETIESMRKRIDEATGKTGLGAHLITGPLPTDRN